MKGTPASSQIIFLENRVKELEEQIDAFEMDGAHAASRITELETALKPFADYWNGGKPPEISAWRTAYLTLYPQSENEPLGPSYGHDGEEK